MNTSKRWHTDMQGLRRHADRGLKVLDTLTDAPPSGDHPALTTRGAVERLDPPAVSQERQPPAIIHVARGSGAVALAWAAWILLCALMIAGGGGGGWIAWLCLGLLGSLRQVSNQVIISTYGVSLRDGVAGHRNRLIPHTDIQAVWASRGLFGRWLGFGRIGLLLRSGEVVWGPAIRAPYAAKQAVIQAVTGRRPLLLPAARQLLLGPEPPTPDPIREAG